MFSCEKRLFCSNLFISSKMLPNRLFCQIGVTIKREIERETFFLRETVAIPQKKYYFCGRNINERSEKCKFGVVCSIIMLMTNRLRDSCSVLDIIPTKRSFQNFENKYGL